MGKTRDADSRSRRVNFQNVDAQRCVTLLEKTRPRQGAVLLIKDLFTPVLSDDERTRRENPLGSTAKQPESDCVLLRCVVRRIEKDYIVVLRLRPRLCGGPQKCIHAPHMNANSAADSNPSQVAAQDLQRGRSPFDKCDIRSAAAKRLQAYGARSRIQIQKGRAPSGIADARRQHVEERFAQAIARGPGTHPRRSFKRARTVRSSDDAHRLRA